MPNIIQTLRGDWDKSSKFIWQKQNLDLSDSGSVEVLKKLFIEYIVVEHIDRDKLDELDKMIKRMDEKKESLKENYTQETIDLFYERANQALKEAVDTDLGQVLHSKKPKYRLEKLLEEKKAKELEGQGLSREEIKRRIDAFIAEELEKIKHPLEYLHPFALQGDDYDLADFDEIFPYDLGELGDITAKQLKDDLGEIIETLTLFSIRDIRDKPAERLKRTKGMSSKVRDTMDKFHRTLQGTKPIPEKIKRFVEEDGEKKEVIEDNPEVIEWRKQNKLMEKDDEGNYLTPYEDIREEMMYDKIGGVTMDADEELKRFNEDVKIKQDTLNLKIKGKNPTLTFTTILPKANKNDENSKSNFLKENNLSFDLIDKKGERISKGKTTLTIDMDEPIIKKFLKEKEKISKVKLSEALLEELKETKINIIPQEALHPFHLSDTVWNFTLKLDSLVEQIKTKETKEKWKGVDVGDIPESVRQQMLEADKEDKEVIKEINLPILWTSITSWTQEYNMMKTGVKGKTISATVTSDVGRGKQREIRDKQKEEARIKEQEKSSEAYWNKNEFIEEGRIRAPTKFKTLTGKEVKHGDRKKWGQELILNYNTGEYEKPTQELIDSQFVYPKGHPNYGLSPQLGEDKYVLSYYITPEESDISEEEKEKKQKSRLTHGTKLTAGAKVSKQIMKLENYFDAIDSRIEDLEDAIEEIKNHKPYVQVEGGDV